VDIRKNPELTKCQPPSWPGKKVSKEDEKKKLKPALSKPLFSSFSHSGFMRFLK
jgi:hypothetical protein